MPWPLVGNARAISALERTLVSDRARHAYLFAGPEHTGRATAANLLAQALNCSADDRPCGACTQCRRIAGSIHVDVQTLTFEIDEDTGKIRTKISIEQLRELEPLIARTPFEGRVRVVIFDPADKMSDEAQNAFLKSLEEPPPHVVFVLITADATELLETVRSRCALIPFSLVPAAEIEAALVARNVAPTDAALFARLSGGRPGWAFDAADDKNFLETRRAHLDQARGLPEAPLDERFDLAQKLAEAFRQDRQNTLLALDEWESWWRDVLVLQSGAEASVTNLDRLDDLRNDASRYPMSRVEEFVQSLGRTRHCLVSNVQARIALDALMLAVPTG
jgi:DNA polymerase-3 subunit delta'